MNRRLFLAQQATGIVMAFGLLVSVYVLASGRVAAAESARLVTLRDANPVSERPGYVVRSGSQGPGYRHGPCGLR